MKFLMTYKGNDRNPSPETMAAIGKFGYEMTQKGVLLMTGGLVRPNTGTQLKYEAGKYSVTDGPFPKTKELISGLCLLQVKSKEEALEWTKRFLAVVGEGETEVRQLHDTPAA